MTPKLVTITPALHCTEIPAGEKPWRDGWRLSWWWTWIFPSCRWCNCSAESWWQHTFSHSILGLQSPLNRQFCSAERNSPPDFTIFFEAHLIKILESLQEKKGEMNSLPVKSDQSRSQLAVWCFPQPHHKWQRLAGAWQLT